MDLHSLIASPLFGVLLAPVVKFGVDKLKAVSKKLDASSPLVKQAVAVGLSVVGAVVSQAVSGAGVDVSGVSQLLSTVLSPVVGTTAAVAALGAVAVKHGEQRVTVSSLPVLTSTIISGPSSTGPIELK